ncbi:LacI family DNA-binding transcriptional regulator [Sinorhizobium meliloti]|uniref:LacI family DNA-binding transcriptional regulator n=1 Tax=Rhizobium meliloti TaxID=382 RepID=UPI003F15EC91
MDTETDKPKRRKRERRTSPSRVTMAEVAREAGVSAQTVSRAINYPEQVGEAVRTQVQEAIRRLNYVPNFAASQMATNRSGIIAVILPSISASIFADTVQGLSTTLLPAGYQILLGHTFYDPEQEEALVRSFLGRGPEGMVVMGTTHTAAADSLLKQAGLPIVETWEWTEDPIDLLVGYSNEDAAIEMVEHLFAKGYRRLVFSGVVESGDARAKARLRGFRSAAQRLGLDADRVLLLHGRNVSMKVGASSIAEIRTRFPDADAVFYSSDVFAAGAVQECLRSGVRVPEDIAIAGFGGFEIAEILIPSLTTIVVPSVRIGQQAADLLLAKLKKQPIGEPRVNVGYKLVCGQST